ncbi:MAG TPA: CoA transferase [Micropepsaceae bacterium]|jgi:crotonobetainyl-CoA:carnitine CoA-transferase CaiB-like acyl-CoA transferase
MAGSDAKDRPLSGVRVLDLTQFLSGPYATQMFADLGADIIKLEPPQGDPIRVVPPHFVGEDSVYYLCINRNKRCVAVDMKMDAGRDLVKRLALASDIVMENFRPGVLDRLGLSVDALRAQKPALIWCSISGFGQDGPYRNKPAYDMIVQALSGGMSLTGETGGAPVRAGIPIGDLAAGLYASVATLAALNRRHRTGLGDTIDISMLDCQAAMLCYQAAYHMHSGIVPGRQGRGHESIPTYRSFEAKDGIHIVITANTERMWQGLTRALGHEEWLADPRFTTNRERLANKHALWPMLEEAFRARDADEWIPILEREEIPVGVVNTLDRVVADPQINHRNMVLELASRDGRAARVTGNPMKFKDAAPEEKNYPRALGADTAAVLKDVLDLSPEEIAELVRGKAVIARNSTGD